MPGGWALSQHGAQVPVAAHRQHRTIRICASTAVGLHPHHLLRNSQCSYARWRVTWRISHTILGERRPFRIYLQVASALVSCRRMFFRHRVWRIIFLVMFLLEALIAVKIESAPACGHSRIGGEGTSGHADFSTMNSASDGYCRMHQLWMWNCRRDGAVRRGHQRSR